MSHLKDLAEKSAAMNASRDEDNRGCDTKRNRVSFFEIYPTLCETLHKVPSHPRVVDNNNNSSDNITGLLEVEVRIGMLVDHNTRLHPQLHQSGGCLISSSDDMTHGKSGYEFKSGIDEDMVEKLRKSFLLENFKEGKQNLQILHFDDSGNRWEVKEKNEIISIPEKKIRLSRVDFSLLAHAYDIRIDAALETPIDMKTVTINPEKWVFKRIKKRTTFRIPDPKAFWHVDLTEVESIGNPANISSSRSSSSNESKEVELEFELEPEGLKTWLAAADKVEVTKAIATQLLRLINLCIPSNMNIPTHANLMKCDNDSIILNQINEYTRVICGSTSGKKDFIGAMPVNISRRNMQHILKSNYFVTEKSDGSRKLLYVVKNKTGESIAIISDRAKNIELLDGSTYIGNALRLGTVLDGELVFNLSNGKYIFLVFDVLMVNNASVINRPFRERLAILQNDIIPRCKLLGTDTSNPCTPIIGKNFYDKRRIQELLSRIKLSNGHRIFFDRESQGMRHHRTDGIIFQPADTAYSIGTDTNLIKWKYEDLMTVDLLIGEDTDGNLTLMCGGPEGTLVDCTRRGAGSITFGPFSSYRLRADLNYLRQFGSSKGRIAEVSYDPSIGMWIYFHFRDDKTTPNHISTVLSVFIEQAEGIDIDELEYRLLARNEAENDYTTQINSMKVKLMDWHKKRTSA